MKIDNYVLMEQSLELALEHIQDIYENVDTSESKDTSERIEKLMDELKCIKEEMIFTFKIEE